MKIEIIKGADNPVAEFFSSSSTPETDKFKIKFKTPCGEKYWVPVEHSERLERERDEARREQSSIQCAFEDSQDKIEQLERERDEARMELNEIRAERDLARLSSMESDQTHDRMVGELERFYKERDEAVAECKSLWSLVNANKLRAYKAERERDEAREAVEYWKEAAKVPSGVFRSLEKSRDQANRDAEYYRERYEQLKDEREPAK